MVDKKILDARIQLKLLERKYSHPDFIKKRQEELELLYIQEVKELQREEERNFLPKKNRWIREWKNGK